MPIRKNLEYVLITPARNEERFLASTILSVISQTILPKRWIIVNDGSTDRTADIIREFAANHRWIQLLGMPEHEDRHFAAKAFAFNAGYRCVSDLSFDIIGNLDADLTFEEDYFEYLLEKFVQHPCLGVAGTPFLEESTFQYDYRYTNIDHVSGACQLFRKQCFEEIGGYIPIVGGGIDWVAVTSARMKGWMTRTFIGKSCIHHRSMGTEKTSALRARYNLGHKDYYLGNHPAWEIFRSLYQMRYKPFVLGGLMLLMGYCVALMKRAVRPIPQELLTFTRAEQLKRLLVKANLIKSKRHVGEHDN